MYEYLGQRLAMTQYMKDFKAVIFFYIVVKSSFYIPDSHSSIVFFFKLTSSLWIISLFHCHQIHSNVYTSLVWQRVCM